jgi:putative ABC transport system permease protein
MFTYTLLQILKVPGRSIQLMFSAFLVFALIFSAMAFEKGMSSSLDVSGDPLNVMVLGMGSEESVERSEIDPAALAAVKSLPGLEKIFDQAAVSPEVVFNTSLKVGALEKEALLRGVTPIALGVYQHVSLEEGDFPRSGEVMVGRLFHQRFGLSPQEVSVGQHIEFEGRRFIISGRFRSPGNVMESEVWINLGDIMALTQRDRYSSITLRLKEKDYGDVELMVKRRQDLQLSAVPEPEYYRQLSSFYEPIRWMAWCTALLIATGALFGGMNSTFAALDGRKKEFATLQAIGYGQSRLAFSMLLESFLIHLSAFLLAGSITLYALPNISMGFGSVYFILQLGPEQLFSGLMLAIIFSVVVTVIPIAHLLFPPLQTHLKD